MAEFYQLKVLDIYKETKDTSVVTFDVPENLHDDFKFHQGQHLTLKKTINGEDVRRSYSLCTSPIEKRWQVAIKQVPGGVFSNYANKELKKGEVLEVMQPTGNF